MYDITRGDRVWIVEDGDGFIAETDHGMVIQDHTTMKAMRTSHKYEMEKFLHEHYPNHTIFHRSPTKKISLELISDH